MRILIDDWIHRSRIEVSVAIPEERVFPVSQIRFDLFDVRVSKVTKDISAAVRKDSTQVVRVEGVEDDLSRITQGQRVRVSKI